MRAVPVSALSNPRRNERYLRWVGARAEGAKGAHELLSRQLVEVTEADKAARLVRREADQKVADAARSALDEIEQVSNQIASLVQNISSSARQQAGSAADVTRRTTRLREIGDQTGKATTATASSIAKLSELATQLRKTVEGFALPADMMQALPAAFGLPALSG